MVAMKNKRYFGMKRNAFAILLGYFGVLPVFGVTSGVLFASELNDIRVERTEEHLVNWDFDDDSMKPTNRSVDNFDAILSAGEAQVVSYINNNPNGRAISANRWNSVEASWTIVLSSVGYKDIKVSSVQRSSATGPANFVLEWSADGLSWKKVTGGEIQVDINWSNSAAEVAELALPDVTSNLPRLWLRWRVLDNIAVNGNNVTTSGTSAIDNIQIHGTRFGIGLPFVEQPRLSVLRNSIQGRASVDGNGHSEVKAAALVCERTDSASVHQVVNIDGIRKVQNIALTDLPQPSEWRCLIEASNDAGTARTDPQILQIQPPPLPYDEKPDLAAKSIQLLQRTDSEIKITWQNGSGERRIATVSYSDETCVADSMRFYRALSEIGAGHEVSPGCFVIYNGYGNSATVEGLTAFTSVTFSVIEYNGDGGRENYRWHDAPRARFQTRPTPPEDLAGLRIYHIDSEQVSILWDIPEDGEVRFALIDEGVRRPDLLQFEKDAYGETVYSPEIERVCESARPCILTREQLQGKLFWGWNVAGPTGHKNVQAGEPEQLNIEWPAEGGFQELANWSFDTEVNVPDRAIWLLQLTELTIEGARDRGYAAGNSGRAFSTDRWNDPNDKHMGFSLSTVGYELMQISFRAVASNTGPESLVVWCEIPETEMFFAGKHQTYANWRESQPMVYDLPEQCLGHPEVYLTITPRGDIARNGNSIAAGGTLRLDDLSIYAKPGNPALPILEAPMLTLLNDETMVLTTKVYSDGTRPLTDRYVQFESILENWRYIYQIDFGDNPFTEVTLREFPKGALVYAKYCVTNALGSVCADSAEIMTPFSIPESDAHIQAYIKGADQIETQVMYDSDDVLLLIGHSRYGEPVLRDSIGITNAHAYFIIDQKYVSKAETVTFKDLTPGTSYRIWAIPVNGTQDVARFARPPFSYTDVAVPKLSAPDGQIVNLHAAQDKSGSVELEWGYSDTTLPQFIVIAGPSERPAAKPNDDRSYRASMEWGKGHKIGIDAYVIASGSFNAIQIDGLKRTREWKITIMPYNELNGAISYAYDTRVELILPVVIQDETYITAREVSVSPPGTRVRISGSVISSVENRLWLATPDGNAAIHTENSAVMFTPGDSLYAVIRVGDVIHELLWIENFFVNPEMQVKEGNVTSELPDSLIHSFHRVNLGNMIFKGLNQETGCAEFQQRGKTRRKVRVCDVSDVLNFGEEGMISGIPVLDRSGQLRIDQSVFQGYGLQKASPVFPENEAVISLSGETSDSLHFTWEIPAHIYPGDFFPDSTQFKYRFIISSFHNDAAIVDTILNSVTFGLPISELLELTGAEYPRCTELAFQWNVTVEKVDFQFRGKPFEEAQFFYVNSCIMLTNNDLEFEERSFEVHSPYPNPFNPSTSVSLYLPYSSNLEIQVFDLLGRHCATIQNGIMSSGRHVFSWNAQGFASGVYIFRIHWNEITQHKMVTLVR